MMRHAFVLSALMLVACKAPASTPDGGAPAATDSVASLVAPPGGALLRRPHPAPVSVRPAPPPVDSRSPEEIALAACGAADGSWRCAGVAHAVRLAAGGRPPLTPPSYSVSFWAVDNSLATTCASDANTCTSTTCGAAGIGPCKTVGEVVSRWGTSAPVLAQATTISFLSDDAAESFDVVPIVASPNGGIHVKGALVTVSTGTLGTVTAKNRATSTLLQANLGQAAAPLVGDMVQNTTRGTIAWIDAASGNVATLTQPFDAITDCTSDFTFKDNTASGDSYAIVRPVKVGLRRVNPTFQSGAVFFPAPTQACVEHVWVVDPSGTPSTSAYDHSISVVIDESRIDPNAFIRTERQLQEPQYMFNNFWNGGLQNNQMSQNAPGIVAGAVYTSNAQGGGVANNGEFIFDGDVILHGFTFISGPYGVIAAAYAANHVAVEGATVQIVQNISPPALYGPGFLQIGSNSTLVLRGTTAAASLLLTGGVFFGDAANLTTASAYDDAGAWHPGITLSPANIDKPIVDGGFGGAAIDPVMHISITTGER